MKRSILITGCSDGSLGSHLCIAFHKAGWRVIATGRNLSKLQHVKDAGLETLQLDVLSAESIANAASSVADLTGGSLDMLINNAGGGYPMPLLDIDFDTMRNVFELNTYSIISMTKAFLPLLRKSKTTHGGVRGGIVVNNTSCASQIPACLPFGGVYNASKAAATSITEVLRLELEPFGIKVVNLLPGTVRSNILANSVHQKLPLDSLFNMEKDSVEKHLNRANFESEGDDPEVWAKWVAAKLSKSNPPHWIWHGKWSTTVWAANFLPLGTLDGVTKSMVGLDVIQKKIREVEQSGKSKLI